LIALDTNLLVYAHRAAVAEHRRARKAIERASRDPRGWGIPLQSAIEFWSVVTHPESRGRPSRPVEAWGFLKALVDAGAALWLPGEGFFPRLAQLAVDLNVRGVRVFDLQIALTAFDNGATEVWSHDGNFVTPAGLKLHDPIA
jgi:predicted nucleic acid-binding protein